MKHIIFFILYTFSCEALFSQLKQGVERDTFYIMDYFYKGPPGINYFGSTTVFLPTGDSVVLKTKPVQIMPVDFDQYAMIKIIMPKDSVITLNIRFSAKKRKTIFDRSEQITIKRTERSPSIYYGRILIENCSNKNKDNCLFRIHNSDSFSRAFLRNIIERNIEKGVTHIYYAETGELIQNPVYYN